MNKSILSFYTQSIVPRITRQTTLALAAAKRAHGITGDDEYEDDGNYGSAAYVDLEVLQAISKRVHYGTCAAHRSPWERVFTTEVPNSRVHLQCAWVRLGCM